MDYTQRMELIRKTLEKSKKVNSFDKGNEKESGTIAHALLDMDQSFASIRNQTHKLESGNLSEDNVNDILHEIGEQLRHVLYHIADMKYYSYLQGSKDKI